jgi:FlaA1/EpsC-like NDP-sugar epimerase
MVKRIVDKKLAIRRIFLLICDVVMIIISSAMGLLLRFDLDPGKVEMRFVESVWRYLPVNMLVTLIIFYILRLYHSIWRFAGIIEMQNVFTATMISSLLQFAGYQISNNHAPRSYYFLYAGTLFLLTLSNRFAYRFVRYLIRQKHNSKELKQVMLIS